MKRLSLTTIVLVGALCLGLIPSTSADDFRISLGYSNSSRCYPSGGYSSSTVVYPAAYPVYYPTYTYSVPTYTYSYPTYSYPARYSYGNCGPSYTVYSGNQWQPRYNYHTPSHRYYRDHNRDRRRW